MPAISLKSDTLKELRKIGGNRQVESGKKESDNKTVEYLLKFYKKFYKMHEKDFEKTWEED